MHNQGSPVEMQTPTPDRPQHDHPATSAIAQQYSFTMFVLLCLIPARKNLVNISKMLIFFF
jgi:hypothetical protein